MIAWLLISFFVLLFLGVPIAMSLGLSAMGGILFLGGGSTVTIAQRMFEGMNSFALLAILCIPLPASPCPRAVFPSA